MMKTTCENNNARKNTSTREKKCVCSRENAYKFKYLLIASQVATSHTPALTPEIRFSLRKWLNSCSGVIFITNEFSLVWLPSVFLSYGFRFDKTTYAIRSYLQIQFHFVSMCACVNLKVLFDVSGHALSLFFFSFFSDLFTRFESMNESAKTFIK